MCQLLGAGGRFVRAGRANHPGAPPAAYLPHVVRLDFSLYKPAYLRCQAGGELVSDLRHGRVGSVNDGRLRLLLLDA